VSTFKYEITATDITPFNQSGKLGDFWKGVLDMNSFQQECSLLGVKYLGTLYYGMDINHAAYFMRTILMY